MNHIVIFGLILILAYIFQIILGFRQLKHFNETYSGLRKRGKVVIGKRAGKIRSGTIVMFAVDPNGRVLQARKMQGVTVWAKFKELNQYEGEDIHYFDQYNPLVRQENKLLQIAIEDARELYLRSEASQLPRSEEVTSAFDIRLQWKHVLTKLKLQLKK